MIKHLPETDLEAAPFEWPSSCEPPQSLALVSIAVSLKRLADVAEAVAMGLYNYDPARDPSGNRKPCHHRRGDAE